jgi:hypothetical protein
VLPFCAADLAAQGALKDNSMPIEVEGSVRLARRANEEGAEAVRGVHETAEELNAGHVVSLLRYRMRDLTPARHQEYSSTAELRLFTLASAMPGFISYRNYTSDARDGRARPRAPRHEANSTTARPATGPR